MPHDQIDFLSRIVILETKLTLVIEKLDKLITSITDRYEGDNNTPSILHRVARLENYERTIRWSIAVLYTASIGVMLKMLAGKL